MTPEVLAVSKLRDAGFSDAAREVRLLWSATMQNRYADPDDQSISAFEALVARRLTHEPISHLLGYRDFYAHRFFVNSNVLDPRPDTETLVEQCLALDFERVLDLGTGSGCILLSLLAAVSNATGVGVDYSKAALDVAAQNAAQMGLESRATIRHSDWFSNVDGLFDLIVSNPPYIAADEMADLQPEVQLHEPRMALTDGSDGLSCYAKILAGHGPFLRANGWLAVEIGPTQAVAVSQMMTDNGLGNMRVVTDLDNRNRVVLGQKLA